MDNLFGKRFQIARKMAGLSLQNVSDRLENKVTKQALSKYEQGLMKPDSSMILSLSAILNVPIDFFYNEPSIEVELKNVDFRKYKSKLTQTQQESIESKVKETFERYFELENIISKQENPDYYKYPNLVSTSAIAEKAADQIRKVWNLGYDPIPDVVEMLEDKGYRVVEIDAPASFDGMKAQIDQKKVIVLRKTSEDYSNVRKRFTALHELAHHVLTFPSDIEQKEEEKLCHAFASAFLYPKEMFLKEFYTSRNHILLNELVLIKERWGISLPAIIYRAQLLGIINEPFAKSFHINYRKLKMHEPGKEPGTFQSKEKPTLFDRLIYLALSKELITINEAAYFANTSVWQFHSQITIMF